MLLDKYSAQFAQTINIFFPGGGADRTTLSISPFIRQLSLPFHITFNLPGAGIFQWGRGLSYFFKDPPMICAVLLILYMYMH